MKNEIKSTITGKAIVVDICGSTRMIQNRMEKKLENEMTSGCILEFT